MKETKMNQFKTIFIKYFLTFFTVLFALVSFITFNDQGKIDLQFSLLFSIPISFLGAALAAVIIGVFRKAEAEPPRVQPPEYLLVDPITLNKQLEIIRRAQFILVALFFMWIPYGLFVIMMELPVLLIFAYMAAMMIISFILMFSKCPRCGNYFHFRREKNGFFGSFGLFGDTDTGSAWLNLLFAPGYRKGISKKCLNCGRSIKNNI
jgi:hypothetical protein